MSSGELIHQMRVNADLTSENRRLRARELELEALVGTVREICGCKLRNVKDIGVEQHSREIGGKVEQLSSALKTLEQRVTDFADGGMSDALHSALYGANADADDVRRYVAMCEANDAARLVLKEG